MFVDRIKSPRCPKCGAMMSLRIIEPERPGFDSWTFECPKCYDTETLVASISCGVDVSLGLPSRRLAASALPLRINGNTAASIATTALCFTRLAQPLGAIRS
jgi:hypothetical protein